MTSLEEVVVGQNHFIVRMNGDTIYAWGCYCTDSEDKQVFRPRLVTHFKSAD